MNDLRHLSDQERALIAALLQMKPEMVPFAGTLDNILVKPMNDGGMGSLLLIPEGLGTDKRTFGRQLVLAEFTDSDGTPVSVALNVDRNGELYELDLWKVDFSPLLTWPRPVEIKIVA